MSTLVSDSSSENSSGAKSFASDNAKNISIEHIDLDELNLIVDGEKLTEARAAQMGADLAKEAHRILRMGNPKYIDLR